MADSKKKIHSTKIFYKYCNLCMLILKARISCYFSNALLKIRIVAKKSKFLTLVNFRNVNFSKKYTIYFFSI